MNIEAINSIEKMELKLKKRELKPILLIRAPAKNRVLRDISG